jgi:two-component system, OmpR family, alkaline phosphatase synthesis response regulator PhoP
MERKRVLIVDDEPQIREVVEAYLQREGLQVETSGTVADALASIQRNRPDMMILDIALPDGSGLDFLRRVSQEHRIPTIMLTARSEEPDRVVGLELGADDYVSKPFSPRELTARVRALFRRVGEAAAGSSGGRERKKTRVADLQIDHEFHEVSVAGRSANLTATEFRILSILAQNPGEVFTRAHLLDTLQDSGDIFERTLDRHINNLRKKLEVDPSKPEYIMTVYGVGYKMRRS